MHKYQIYSNNLDTHTFRLLTITTTEAKEKVNQGRVPKQSEMLLLPTYTNLDFSSHTRDVSWRVAPFHQQPWETSKEAFREDRSRASYSLEVLETPTPNRHPPVHPISDISVQCRLHCLPSQPGSSIFADAFCFFSGCLNDIVFLTRVSGMVVRWCFPSIFQVSNCLAPVGGCQTIIQPSG